jgi:hypothetical protein
MSRPKLLNQNRKDWGIKIRVTKSDKIIVLEQIKIHNCKTMSDYIRKLVKDDINKKGPN